MPLNYVKKIWTGILLAMVLVANAFIVRESTRLGLSTGWILLFRGSACLIFIACICFYLGYFPSVKQPKIQLLRLIVAGGSLTCATASYAFVGPATVTLLGRLDIPLLAIFGAVQSGRFKSSRMIFAIFAIVWFIASSLHFRNSGESLIGYVLAGCAGVLVAVGFLFVHRSANTEAWPVVIATPALASLIFGTAINVGSSSGGANWSEHLIHASILAAFAGVVMFGIYFVMILRHRMVNAHLAELPGAMVPILILCIDRYLFDVTHDWDYTIAIVVGAALVLATSIPGRIDKT